MKDEMMEEMKEMMEEMKEQICLFHLLSCLSWGLAQDPSALCLCGPKFFIAPIVSCFFRDPVCQQEPGLWDKPQVLPICRVQPERLFLPQWHDYNRGQHHWYQRTPAQIPPGFVHHKGLGECCHGWRRAHSKDLQLCPLGGLDAVGFLSPPPQMSINMS